EVSLDGAQPSGTIGFPLVIYSHGGGGNGDEADTLMESLASHGFVVAAPNHLGGDILVFGGGGDSAEGLRRNRPRDVSLVIDALLARNLDPLDPLAAHINPHEIGVAGFSFGGWTATAMASGHTEPSTGLEVPPDPRVRAVATIARGNGGYESPD